MILLPLSSLAKKRGKGIVRQWSGPPGLSSSRLPIPSPCSPPPTKKPSRLGHLSTPCSYSRNNKNGSLLRLAETPNKVPLQGLSPDGETGHRAKNLDIGHGGHSGISQPNLRIPNHKMKGTDCESLIVLHQHKQVRTMAALGDNRGIIMDDSGSYSDRRSRGEPRSSGVLRR